MMLPVVLTVATALVDDLERAARLHRSGDLSDAEFASLKAHVLSTGSKPGSQRFFGKGWPDGLMPAGREFELFAYNVSGSAGAVLTQFQLYGTGDPLVRSGFNDTRLRYYVDDEEVASLDMLLYLAHGIGARGSPQHAAWGTTRWGSSIGDRPSVYNTIRVPFTRSLRITAQLPPRVRGMQRFWLDVFGVEGLPISIGGGTMLLPPTEYRLRLHANEGVLLPPQEYVTVADSQAADGLLYFLVVSTLSHGATPASAYGFLEGCWLWGDGASNTSSAQLLTSGGEELFFGTAYFFNRSYAVLPDAAVTEHVTLTTTLPPGVPPPLTAAVIFDERPITFGGSGLRIFWQNGAWLDERPGSPTHGVKCYGRSAAEGAAYGGVAGLELSTYAFTYERVAG